MNVGEEHPRSPFLSNSDRGSITETARTGREATSGLSRTH